MPVGCVCLGVAKGGHYQGHEQKLNLQAGGSKGIGWNVEAQNLRSLRILKWNSPSRYIFIKIRG